MGEHLTVRCACGWETSGDEDAVVEATSEHGQRLHNMSATRDEILAMATPSNTTDAPPAQTATPATATIRPIVGQRATWTRTFGPDEVEAFAVITGDRNPLHFDPDFAAATRVGRLVVQGGLTTGLFNALVAMELPGPGSVFLHQEWDYPAPVHVGDTVTAEAEVIAVRADKPITTLRCEARRDDGTVVLRGECLVYTMRADDRPTD
jgi:acyl dehydratase/predicted small metal-binding protein